MNSKRYTSEMLMMLEFVQESKEALLSLTSNNTFWSKPNVNRYKEVLFIGFPFVQGDCGQNGVMSQPRCCSSLAYKVIS